MKIGLSTLMLCISAAIFGAVTPVGKINGKPIFKDDLERLPEMQNSTLSAFDRLVLFRLAVEQARKEKLEQTPTAKHDIDLVLYRHFLEARLKQESQKLAPAEEEIRVYYDQNPMLRLRHLVLRFNNSNEQSQALSQAAKIDTAVKAAQDFGAIAREYSEDETASIGGDIGERGLHNLHEDFYLKLPTLPPGGVSPRIETRTGIHYFQLVNRIAFPQAAPQYISFLTKKLTQDREHRFLTQVLTNLKRKANIEVTNSARNE